MLISEGYDTLLTVLRLSGLAVGILGRAADSSFVISPPILVRLTQHAQSLP
jgi:hypothetical protein